MAKNKTQIEIEPNSLMRPENQQAVNGVMQAVGWISPTFNSNVGLSAPTPAIAGVLAYADGTNWNPGSGQGFYYYDGTMWQPVYGIIEQAVTDADSVTINFSSGATAYMVLDRATTAITLSGGINGHVYRLRLTQDGSGSRAVTWSTTVLWKGGSAPTLTTTINKSDWITLVKSGGNWYGDVIKNF